MLDNSLNLHPRLRVWLSRCFSRLWFNSHFLFTPGTYNTGGRGSLGGYGRVCYGSEWEDPNSPSRCLDKGSDNRRGAEGARGDPGRPGTSKCRICSKCVFFPRRCVK